MDTYSLTAASRVLGTSAPRVRRAIDRLGIPAQRSSSGVFCLTSRQVDKLARDLGITVVVPGLSRVEARVLAALSRSPRGVVSIREAGRRAGVSPTATGRALARLTSDGLITQTPTMVARGHATEVTVYRVRFRSAEWLRLAPLVAKIHLPTHPEGTLATRVPPHLLHLFWNVAPTQLDVATSATFIARRLITSFDPDGLAWGTVNLPPSAWEHAAATRGLEPAQRALAHNLARYTPHAI
jgi:hypothetical protein